ncbi:hypothetical protein [Streptomyces sp. NPDC058953]|uniref:hypothetical protein n=1 Tax=Streptomyces sp. NPDC058953 TaxID=3346676 RepID=UPI00368F8AFB
MRPPGTTRRRALAVTGAAAGAVATGALTGCSGEPSETGGRDRARGAQGAREQANAPDARLRKRLASSGGVLRDRYDAVLAAHPALAELAAAERRSSAAYTAALEGAGPELARLLASVAAAGAAHAYLLSRPTGDPGTGR